MQILRANRRTQAREWVFIDHNAADSGLEIMGKIKNKIGTLWQVVCIFDPQKYPRILQE